MTDFWKIILHFHIEQVKKGELILQKIKSYPFRFHEKMLIFGLELILAT